MQKLFIVIPALNEENLLPKTLESLNEQDTSNFSVIVVDNGSSDHTVQVVSDYTGTAKYKLYLVKENKRGVGYARTTGTDLAVELGADYIGGTDADTLFPKNWVGSILAGFRNSAADLLCGECVPSTQWHFEGKTIDFILTARKYLFNKVKPFFRGANYAISKEIYLKVGKINQPLTYDNKPAPGEDGELEKSVYAKGGNLSGCLASVFSHPRRHIKNMQRISEFDGQTHEGGVVTQIRNEDYLENYVKTVSVEVVNKFVEKVSLSMFNQEVLQIYREPLFKDKYWEKVLPLLKPFGRNEIETDLDTESADYVVNKYLKIFYDNINRQVCKRSKPKSKSSKR